MENIIKHDNIFYIRDFSELGGVETFTWELVKKYKDNDIAVVYKTAHINQLKRVKKYCRAYRHTNQKIECKVAIINYDVSIIDYITSDIYAENLKRDDKRGIYQVIHGDYAHSAYKWKPPTDKRIKTYIAVTQYVLETFKQLTGVNNVICGYNPLTIEKEEEKIILLSATRISPIKGKERMIKLANRLDNAGVNYVWLIFTNDTNAINSPNVIYCKPNLNIGWWFEKANYIVQLSDTEACSYTINEALYRNKPVIVTPLPYLKEIGVEHGKNAYILNFDCSNIDEIVEKIKDIPKFNFKKLEDKYNEIIVKGKSRYEEEKNMKVKAKCIMPRGYDDLELKRHIEEDEIFFVEDTSIQLAKDRAEYLEKNKAIEILEYIEDEKKEEKIELPEKVKPKATTKKATTKNKKKKGK